MTLNDQIALTEVGLEPERMADRMYHDLLSPPEVQEVRSRVRDAALRTVRPVASRIANADERLDGFPRDVFESMTTEGLFRIPFRTDVGGSGLTHPATATAVAVEELAYYSNSVAAIYDVHCILAGTALDQGTDEQRRRWLAPIVAGEIVGSFATSEPGASSDLSRLRCRLLPPLPATDGYSTAASGGSPTRWPRA